MRYRGAMLVVGGMERREGLELGRTNGRRALGCERAARKRGMGGLKCGTLCDEVEYMAAREVVGEIKE